MEGEIKDSKRDEGRGIQVITQLLTVPARSLVNYWCC